MNVAAMRTDYVARDTQAKTASPCFAIARRFGSKEGIEYFFQQGVA